MLTALYVQGLCLFGVFILLILRRYWRKEPGVRIPGPTPWPVLGNLIDFSTVASPTNPIAPLIHFAKVYGDIVQFELGGEVRVLVSSKKAIEGVFGHPAANSRDRNGVFYDRMFGGMNVGTSFTDGEVWEENRSWMFKNLKSLGLGKSTALKSHVDVVLENLIWKIEGQMDDKGCVEMDLLFSESMYTIAWRIMVGGVGPGDEERIADISKKMEYVVRAGITGIGLIDIFPFLRKIFPKLLNYDGFMNAFNTADGYGKKLFHSHLKKWKDEDGENRTPSNIFEAYISSRVLPKKDDADLLFHERNMMLSFGDILGAAGETTSTFMEILVLYMTLFPEIQDKIYTEILQRRSETGKPVEFSDRQSMTYTQAVILETHRIAAPLPNLVARIAKEDFAYKDHVIKKGTILCALLETVNMDERVWKEPGQYKPERFLNSDGKIVNAKELINFGVGRRSCPGEIHGTIISFVFLVRLIERYELTFNPKKNKPSTELVIGMTAKPPPFEVIFKRRGYPARK